MEIVLTVIITAVCLFLIDMFLLAGRTNNADINKFTDKRYAHRGLHGKSIPENSMAAFKKAAEKGCGIELDVHLMKDGNLAVIHDSSLKRTTGFDIQIEQLVMGDLERFTLEGTGEKIPLLDEVLAEINGKVPLLIEIKTASNYASLTKKTVEKLSSYKGDYLIESFDPRVIAWLRKNAPHIIRGQLTQNFFKNTGDQPFFIRLLLTPMLLNVLARPDFVAVRKEDRNAIQIKIALKLLKIKGFVWTAMGKDELLKYENEGYTAIFE